MINIPRTDAIDIALDKPRKMRLEFGAVLALRDAKDAYGHDLYPDAHQLITQVLRVDGEVDSKNLRAGDMRAIHGLLWAALLEDDPTLTRDEVSQLITYYISSGAGNLADLALAVWGAWHAGGLGAAERTNAERSKNAEAEAAAVH